MVKAVAMEEAEFENVVVGANVMRANAAEVELAKWK